MATIQSKPQIYETRESNGPGQDSHWQKCANDAPSELEQPP